MAREHLMARIPGARIEAEERKQVLLEAHRTLAAKDTPENVEAFLTAAKRWANAYHAYKRLITRLDEESQPQ